MKSLAIGVDIGGTNTLFALTDSQGKLYGSGSLSTPLFLDFDLFIRELRISIDALLYSARRSIGDLEVVGIGVGAPSANSISGTIECGVNLPWSGTIPLRDEVSRSFGALPVFIDNDANTAALGEMLFGGARGMRNFIAVTLGTGVGGGFIINGELMIGHSGFAGELGHTVIHPNGRLCSCGNCGCLESYVSSRGVVQSLLELLCLDTDSSSLLEGVPRGELTPKSIARAANAGDSIAFRCFDQTARDLGLGLANAVMITSPEAIFLLGGIAQSGDLLLSPTKSYMEHYLFPNFRNSVALRLSSLEPSLSPLLGASALVWSGMGVGPIL